jgi:ABC-type antimicrobial peptide transport system permease subunit
VFTDSTQKNYAGKLEYSPYLLADRATQAIPEIEKATRLLTASWISPLANVNGQLFNEKKFAYIDENWFNVFHYGFVKGNANSFFSNPFSIILTESKAKQYFGNSESINRIVVLDSINYYVRAVIKDNPGNSSFQFDGYIPLSAYMSKKSQRLNEESWGVYNYVTFLKIKSNSSVSGITDKLNSILASNRTGASGEKCYLSALRNMHFESSLTAPFAPAGSYKAVYIFTTISLLILITASINNINFTFANATLRIKEVSIRKIIGGKFSNLFARFFVEYMLLSFLALIFSLLLCWIFLPVFNKITGDNFSPDLSAIDLWVLMAAALIIVVLLNSAYPALLLSRLKPLDVFKGNSSLNLKGGSIRKGLLLLQFCVSLSLIVAAAIIFQQLKYIGKSDLEYNKSQVFSFSLPVKYRFQYDDERRATIINGLKHALLTNSDIKEVSVASQSIIGLQSVPFKSVDWPGKDRHFIPVIAMANVDDNYKRFFNLNLAEGKWFEENASPDDHGFILNETAIKELNIPAPILGSKFSLSGDSGKIIGIVRDFHYSSLHDKIGALVFYSHPGRQLKFFVKTADYKVLGALHSAAAAWKQFVPDYPFDYSFLDEDFNRLYRSDQRTYVLISVFSLISVAISTMGLLGLAYLIAKERTKEIAVRKLLGASFSHITILLSKDFISLFLLAEMISTPFIWLVMNHWLHDFAYRVSIGLFTFIGAGCLIFLVVISITATVVLRASKINTARLLRTS